MLDSCPGEYRNRGISFRPRRQEEKTSLRTVPHNRTAKEPRQLQICRHEANYRNRGISSRRPANRRRPRAERKNSHGSRQNHRSEALAFSGAARKNGRVSGQSHTMGWPRTHTHFKRPDTKLITATEASALALLPINGALAPKGKPAMAGNRTNKKALPRQLCTQIQNRRKM